MSTTAPSVDPTREAPARAGRDRVDVWQVAIGAGDGAPGAATLTEAERALGARLRIGADAWMASRAALRRILARYLGVAPAEVALESDANGKPRLAPGRHPDLRFNLSHSGDVALVALRLGHEVGVDVERLRPDVDGIPIAREVFSARERAAMPRLAPDDPAGAFFRAWVRHEALAKATGRGIGAPPGDGDARFTTRDLDGIPGYAAAVTSAGTAWHVWRVGPEWAGRE